MKRYIKAGNYDFDSYDRVRAAEVLKECLQIKSDADTEKTQLYDTVNEWKQANDLIFHHVDMNTSHNVPSNIMFLTKQAHGYLHSFKFQNFLREYFVFPDISYTRGRFAEDDEQKLMLDAIKLTGKSPTLQDVIDEIHHVGAEHFNDSTHSNLYVNYSDVAKIKTDYMRSMNLSSKDLSNVYCVDSDTAWELTQILDEEMHQSSSTDRIKYHSLKVVRDFIAKYNTTRSEILNQLHL